eukprot:6174636-Pleurochrysis_carterae.AAC.2
MPVLWMEFRPPAVAHSFSEPFSSPPTPFFSHIHRRLQKLANRPLRRDNGESRQTDRWMRKKQIITDSKNSDRWRVGGWQYDQ